MLSALLLLHQLRVGSSSCLNLLLLLVVLGLEPVFEFLALSLKPFLLQSLFFSLPQLLRCFPGSLLLHLLLQVVFILLLGCDPLLSCVIFAIELESTSGR